MAGRKLVKRRIKAGESGLDQKQDRIITALEGTKMPSEDVRLTVGEVEKLTGVTVATLRHYDKIGLLSPERTGEGVANNRKLYSAADLEQLQVIVTLVAYGFSLDEVRHVLDADESDVQEMLAEKLLEFKRVATRLHNLDLFVKFTAITDSNLIDGLMCGPAILEELANLSRSCNLYEIACKHLDEFDENAPENTEILETFDAVIDKYSSIDAASGFAGVKTPLKMFCQLWEVIVIPLDLIGYLGFWAVFEDRDFLAFRAEEIGGKGTAGFIEMHLFFMYIKSLIKNTDGLLAEIAQLSDTDVLASVEKANEFVDQIAIAMLGKGSPDLYQRTDLVTLASYTLVFMIETVFNEELNTYLSLRRTKAFNPEELRKVAKILDLLGGNDGRQPN